MNRLIMMLPIFVAILSVLSGCNILADALCENKELIRLVSPDNRIEAVLVRTSCGGATTSFSYQIVIVPLGKEVERSDAIFMAEKLEGERLQWKSPRELEINYQKAKIVKFKNFWQSKDVDNSEYIVNITERQN